MKGHLANFSAELSLHTLPSSVVDRAKLLFLDSFVSVVSGIQTPIAQSTIKNLSSWSSKEFVQSHSSIPGNYCNNNSLLSALIYGISMVCQELDEGNAKAKGHPSCHFFPAILVEAERKSYSGKQLLEAFIVGYEINARAGAAIKLRKDIHPHGSWGLIGGGYAVGRLNYFSKEEYDSMLRLTSSLPFISLWNPIFEGQHTRDLMIGLNNVHILILPAIVKSGISSSIRNMEIIYSTILGESINKVILSDGLGDEYYLMSSYFKFYPFCRFCHSPMEGVKELIESKNISIEAIEKITVYTYEAASKLNQSYPVNEYAGKFSIPYAVSQFLQKEYGRTVDASLIHVEEDCRLTTLLPDVRSYVIEMYVKDGIKQQLKWHHAPGDAGDNHLREQVIQKNLDLLSNVIGQKQAEIIIEQLLDLDNIENFSNILKNMR